jgi:predicted O-linked N-acetylglucosamine transferase (SPINDLY family)
MINSKYKDQIQIAIELISNKDFKGSAKIVEELIQKFPNDFFLENFYGTIFLNLKQYDIAENYFKLSINNNKKFFSAYYNLGLVFNEKKDYKNTILYLNKLLEFDENFECIYLIGLAYCGINDFNSALKFFHKALKIKQTKEVYHEIGAIYKQLRFYDLALINYEKCLIIDENYLPALNNIGVIKTLKKDFFAAKEYFEKSIKLKNNSSHILCNMAQSQFDVLNFNEGLKYFEDSLKYDYSAKNLGQYLFNSLYVENFDLNKYLNLAKKFTSIVNKQKISDYKIDFKNNNLIIGFISGDFREHAVAYQITGLIRELKKYKDIKLFAYSNNDYEDNKTQELKNYFDKFENVFYLYDDLLIKKIVDDKINILIDLSGYSSQNRLSIFLAKPAPVQVTGFGFLQTTGLKEIDYILADKNIVTDSKNFTEEVLVDQETWSTLDLNNIDIKAEELPAKKNRHITFGAFNNFHKLNEETFKLWAEILKNVKGSKILLNNHTYENIKVKDYVHSLFEKNNIPSSRITIENGGNREKILHDYNKIDILLDTYPYGGGTTSLESAWMCVPILTISGNSFVSRGATSVNLSLGMSDWNCKNKIEYLEKAINFSSDIDLLSEIKSQLIKKRKTINIFDNVSYAKNFYFMMRNVWNKYLEQNI